MGEVGGDRFVLRHENDALVTIQRPDAETFRKQLKFLRNYADQRGDRAAEILTQVGYPADYFATILGLNGDAHRHTFELIAVAQGITSHLVLLAKHTTAVAAPDRVAPA